MHAYRAESTSMGAGLVIALCIAAVVVAAILCWLALGIAVKWTRRHPRPGARAARYERGRPRGRPKGRDIGRSGRAIGRSRSQSAARATKAAWQIPLRANRLLIVAVLAELVMLAAFLYIPPLAHLLGQSGPNFAGVLVAVLAVPAVLAADTLQKQIARSRKASPRGYRPIGRHLMRAKRAS